MENYFLKSKPLTDGALYSLLEYCHRENNISVSFSTLFKTIKEFHGQNGSDILIVFDITKNIRGFFICNLILGKLNVSESDFENSSVLKLLIETIVEKSKNENFTTIEIHDNDFSNDIEFQHLQNSSISSRLNFSFIDTVSSFLK